MQWLDLDDDYIEAPGLGALAKVFNQDTLNLPYVQKGLHNLKEVIFANYETYAINYCVWRVAQFFLLGFPSRIGDFRRSTDWPSGDFHSND